MSATPINLSELRASGAAWVTEAQLEALVEAVKAAEALRAFFLSDTSEEDSAGEWESLVDALARFSFADETP